MVEAAENAAFGDRMRRRAARAQRLQVPLQHAEFADALRYMANVLVKRCIDLATVLCRAIAKLNQCADLVRVISQPAALADEC